MTMTETVAPFYPTLKNFTFSADANIKVFSNEQEAHDELLAVYFSAIRERESILGKRMSDAASMKEFQSLWRIWRMYVARSNAGEDLPVMV